jgi:hypothetical protein
LRAGLQKGSVIEAFFTVFENELAEAGLSKFRNRVLFLEPAFDHMYEGEYIATYVFTLRTY